MLTDTELNKLVDAITEVGYKVTDLLNRHLDAGDISEEEANDLREIAAHLANANSEAWRRYLLAKG